MNCEKGFVTHTAGVICACHLRQTFERVNLTLKKHETGCHIILMMTCKIYFFKIQKLCGFSLFIAISSIKHIVIIGGIFPVKLFP